MFMPGASHSVTLNSSISWPIISPISLDQFYIPALCQKCSDRNCGTELIIGCSAFFLRLTEETAFQGSQEIARYDLSVVYLIFSLQTKTCRSVDQSNRGYIPRLLRSTRGCLRCCSRNRNSCGAKRVACALPGSPVARSAS